MNKVYSLYSVANASHPGVWPRLNQCEAELIGMTSDLLHGRGIGCTTSGGTENIMLAIKAHCHHCGKLKGIAFPKLICWSMAHAAVDKACEVLGIHKFVIDCDDGKMFTLNPKLVRRQITCNTIMIYASASNFPQGTIDPIEALGKLAKEHDIGLHVHGYLGGFILPFVGESSKSSFPKFDFQVPGVTSMSADTHKFGYTSNGTSVVLYRDNALRHAQNVCYAQWTGGLYVTPTLWTSLVTIGKEGYRVTFMVFSRTPIESRASQPAQRRAIHVTTPICRDC
jgi:sphinganine-1-phosphate aldolase